MSVVICGHVGRRGSTTTGRLLFELGGILEREPDKSTREAERLGKSAVAIAFYMDRQKEEKERGMIIACNAKKFFNDRWNFTWPDTRANSEKWHLTIETVADFVMRCLYYVRSTPEFFFFCTNLSKPRVSRTRLLHHSGTEHDDTAQQC